MKIVMDNVKDNVSDNIDECAWTKNINSVRGTLLMIVMDNVRDNVNNSVRDNVKENIWDNVATTVYGKTFSDEQLDVAFNNLELL